jgi:hypothetical protein
MGHPADLAVLLAAAVLLLAATGLLRPVAEAVDRARPFFDGGPVDVEHVKLAEGVCPRCAAAVREASVAFARAVRGLGGPAETGPAAVRGLFDRRAALARAMSEVRLRLPNDLDLEARWVRACEAADGRMLRDIEDARVRYDVPLLHPGPIGDAWYGRWYRAAGDELR